MKKVDKHAIARLNKFKIDRFQALKLNSQRRSKPLIISTENMDDSTIDGLTTKMRTTDMFKTNPKWAFYDLK